MIDSIVDLASAIIGKAKEEPLVSANEHVDSYFVVTCLYGSTSISRFTKKELLDSIHLILGGYPLWKNNATFVRRLESLDETSLMIIKGHPVIPTKVPVKVQWDVE